MSWHGEIAAVFGSDVVLERRVKGGDLSELVEVALADGQRMAVKHGRLVGTEARMLQAMRLTGAPVPQVLHQGGTLLCLEWLEETPATATGWRALGAALRKLHATGGSDYGWPEDFALGAVALDNRPRESWPAFWAEARLLPFAETLPSGLARRVEAVAHSLPDRLPAQPDAALLHGDLWSGNALFTAQGAYLIDPACYHGHAEVDLAMLDLFSVPEPGFWAGYGEGAPGRETRRPVYQLFPALVHLTLFGNAYGGMVTRLLEECGA